MGITKALDSGSIKRLSVASMLVEAVLAIARGKRRLGVLLLGAAALATRSTALGFLAQIVIRLYQWRR